MKNLLIAAMVAAPSFAMANPFSAEMEAACGLDAHGPICGHMIDRADAFDAVSGRSIISWIGEPATAPEPKSVRYAIAGALPKLPDAATMFTTPMDAVGDAVAFMTEVGAPFTAPTPDAARPNQRPTAGPRMSPIVWEFAGLEPAATQGATAAPRNARALAAGTPPSAAPAAIETATIRPRFDPTRVAAWEFMGLEPISP